MLLSVITLSNSHFFSTMARRSWLLSLFREKVECSAIRVCALCKLASALRSPFTSPMVPQLSWRSNHWYYSMCTDKCLMRVGMLRGRGASGARVEIEHERIECSFPSFPFPHFPPHLGSRAMSGRRRMGECGPKRTSPIRHATPRRQQPSPNVVETNRRPRVTPNVYQPTGAPRHNRQGKSGFGFRQNQSRYLMAAPGSAFHPYDRGRNRAGPSRPRSSGRQHTRRREHDRCPKSGCARPSWPTPLADQLR